MQWQLEVQRVKELEGGPVALALSYHLTAVLLSHCNEIPALLVFFQAVHGTILCYQCYAVPHWARLIAFSDLSAILAGQS